MKGEQPYLWRLYRPSGGSSLEVYDSVVFSWAKEDGYEYTIVWWGE